MEDKKKDKKEDKEKDDDLPINKIILGNCIDEMEKLPDGIASLVITDPPFGIDYESRLRSERFGKIEGDGKNDPVLSWSFSRSYRVLKNNSHFYTFTRWDCLPRFISLLEYWQFSIKNCIIGERAAHSCGDLNYAFSPSYEMILFAQKGKRDFNKTTIKRLSDGNGYVRRFDDCINWLPVNEPSKNIMFHPTQKSLELTEFFMLLSSNKGDIVIDPFSGSGVVAVAAWDLGRKFICYEINEEYHKKSLKYLEEFKKGKHNDILNRVHKLLGHGNSQLEQASLVI